MFFDTKEVEAFAVALASDLARRFPPASEARSDKGAKSQLAHILDDLAARAAAFHAQKTLGIYKKAKLGNVLRWKLKELGFSEDFCENATAAIITRLAATRS